MSLEVCDVSNLTLSFPSENGFVEDSARDKALKSLMQQKLGKLPQDFQLNMNEVLNGLEMQDLCGDGGVLKYIVQQGNEQAAVTERSQLRVRYELRNIDGSLKDPQKQRTSVHKISLSSPKPMLIGLKEAFRSMLKGEISWFRLNGKYNYSEGNEVQEEQEYSVYYKIEMVDIEFKTPLNHNSIEERFSFLQTLKQKANKYFQQSKFEQAIKEYQKGLNFLFIWPKPLRENDVMKEVMIQKLIFSNNTAQCYMEMSEYEKAQILLNDILSQTRNMEIENKTYYRIAKCQFKLGEFDRCLSTLRQFKELCTLSNDQETDVVQLQSLCKSKLRDEHRDLQSKFKKIKQSN